MRMVRELVNSDSVLCLSQLEYWGIRFNLLVTWNQPWGAGGICRPWKLAKMYKSGLPPLFWEQISHSTFGNGKQEKSFCRNDFWTKTWRGKECKDDGEGHSRQGGAVSAEALSRDELERPMYY